MSEGGFSFVCDMEENLLQTTCWDEMQSKYHLWEEQENLDQNKNWNFVIAVPVFLQCLSDSITWPAI